jgi:hypothetical protein
MSLFGAVITDSLTTGPSHLWDPESPHLVEKYVTFHVIRSLITRFIKLNHISPSCTRWIPLNEPCNNFLSSVYMLPSRLYLCRSLHFMHAAWQISSSLICWWWCNTQWTVKILTLLIMQFSPYTYYSDPLKPKHSPLHPALKTPCSHVRPLIWQQWFTSI